ncbi:MAG: B12-binding domain-containing protein [Actinomycetota bacterium]
MSTKYLTLPEVSKLLNVHYMTVYRYVREGMLPAVQVNRSWQISRADLKEFQVSRLSSSKNNKSMSKSGIGSDKKARHGSRDTAEWADRVLARLIEGDEAGVSNVINSALRSTHNLQSIYLDVLMPALVTIGDRWEQGRLDIYVEHRATEIVSRLIGQLSSKFTRRGVDRGTVIIVAPEGEKHSLSIALAADVLRLEGWKAMNLGANLPASELAKAVKSTQNLVGVCITTTMSGSLRETANSISAVRDIAGFNVKCFVAGLAVKSQDQAQKLGADFWVASPRELIVALDSLSQKVS